MCVICDQKSWDEVHLKKERLDRRCKFCKDCGHPEIAHNEIGCNTGYCDCQVFEVE